jgi:hypothetical protein
MKFIVQKVDCISHPGTRIAGVDTQRVHANLTTSRGNKAQITRAWGDPATLCGIEFVLTGGFGRGGN